MIDYSVQQKTAMKDSDDSPTFEEYIDFHCLLMEQVAAKVGIIELTNQFIKLSIDRLSKRRTKLMPHSAKLSMISSRQGRLRKWRLVLYLLID